MIDISFVNLILIIADNSSDSREPGNPYSFAFCVPGSLHHSTSILSGSPRPSAPVESSYAGKK